MAVSDDEQDLHRLIEASLKSIDQHIGSVEQLPIESTYKKELSSILLRIQAALSAARPILVHLSQVQNLVIKPVQVGVDRAFKASNRWGVIGLQVSVLSLVLSTGLSLYPDLFATPRAADPARLLAKNLDCMTPKIDHLLKNIDTDDGSTYLAGSCLGHAIAKLGSIDVPVTALSDALVKVDVARAHIRLEDQVFIAIQNYAQTMSERAPRYILTRPTPELANHVRVKADSIEGYVSQTEFPASLPRATIVATAKLQWTLGSDPNYFGHKAEITDERQLFVDVPALKASKSARYFAVVDAIGIGPRESSDKWLAHTSFTFNSESYDLAEYWPYWGDARARLYAARFVIPLQATPALGSRNTFSFRSGRYVSSDGSVALDNLMIQSLSVAVADQE